MKSILSRVTETQINANQVGLGLLTFRVLSAFALLRTHGLPKLLDFQGTLQHIPDPMGLGSTFSAYYAVFANVICAVLVILGLFTRFAALAVLSITLSGLLIVHISDPAKVQDVPLIYSIVFGIIAYLGAGKFSLDHQLFKTKG
ncbi:DoxX family protein [Flagellimonas meridianipacifica]|uniref:Putative oxidoreductase n=1 Tax=Flagellimonas meridianipacifica TaxID=1080225 RepID=A0A2T0MJC8_9FLAO|nr:DoxX family protein [Allomuricauda pacifica]PRX57606.1 putative oxidoreductase [Allomuricauda pacifica]